MTEIWAIRILSFLLAWFFLSYLRKCYELSSAKERLKIYRDSYESSIEKNFWYKTMLHDFAVFSNEKDIYDDSVKEAVRYAMLKSHPDNGGRKEDFIKFRELYKKMEEENGRSNDD